MTFPKQEKRIAKYLLDNFSINPLTAWKECGVYRLSAVILKLRKKGMHIVTERTNVKNQFGEDCKVANYRLMYASFEGEDNPLLEVSSSI